MLSTPFFELDPSERVPGPISAGAWAKTTIINYFDCSIDAFRLIGFLVRFDGGPGGFREGPGSPRNPDAWSCGSPGRVKKQKTILDAGPSKAAQS